MYTIKQIRDAQEYYTYLRREHDFSMEDLYEMLTTGTTPEQIIQRRTQ